MHQQYENVTDYKLFSLLVQLFCDNYSWRNINTGCTGQSIIGQTHSFLLGFLSKFLRIIWIKFLNCITFLNISFKQVEYLILNFKLTFPNRMSPSFNWNTEWVIYLEKLDEAGFRQNVHIKLKIKVSLRIWVYIAETAWIRKHTKEWKCIMVNKVRF